MPTNVTAAQIIATCVLVICLILGVLYLAHVVAAISTIVLLLLVGALAVAVLL